MIFRSLSRLCALALPAGGAQAPTPADVAVLAGPCAVRHGPPGPIPAIASFPTCAGILAGIVTGLRLTRAAPPLEPTP